jgi:hypothetical protein
LLREVRLLLEENFADGAEPLLDQQAFMLLAATSGSNVG